MEIPKDKRLEYFLDGLRQGKEISGMAKDLGISPNSLYAYKSGLDFFGLLNDVLKENPECFIGKEELLKRQKFLDDYLIEKWADTPIEEIMKDTGFKSRVVLENFIVRRRKSGVPIPARRFNEGQKEMEDYFKANWESAPMEKIFQDTGKCYNAARNFVQRARKRGVSIPERKYEVHNAYTADENWQAKKKLEVKQEVIPPPKPKEKKPQKQKIQEFEKKITQEVKEEVVVPPPVLPKKPEAVRQPLVPKDLGDNEILPRGPKALDDPNEPGSKVVMPDLDKYGKLDPPKSPDGVGSISQHVRMSVSDLEKIHKSRKEKTQSEIEDEAREIQERIRESQQE